MPSRLEELYRTIKDRYGLTAPEIIKKAFSKDPKEYELQELAEQFVIELIKYEYDIESELWNIFALAKVMPVYMYQESTGENIENHVDYLIYSGFKEVAVSGMRKLPYNLLYTFKEATACFYSVKDNVVVLCDRPALLVNTVYKKFAVLETP